MPHPSHSPLFGHTFHLFTVYLTMLLVIDTAVLLAKSKCNDQVNDNELDRACRVLVGKPEGKISLGKPRSRSEDNIKMHIIGIGWDVDNIYRAQLLQ
jgi:hypothetical protein